MNKLLACGFAAVLAPAVVDSAYAEVSAKSYIQDGLVAHWDAIENAGFGQHDNAATVWKDLKGAHDLTVMEGLSTWSDNSIIPVAKVHTGIAIDKNASALASSHYQTIDACVTYRKETAFIVGQGSRAVCWHDNGFVGRNTKYTCKTNLTAGVSYSIYVNYSGATASVLEYRLDGVEIAESEDTRQELSTNGAFEFGRSYNEWWSSYAPAHAARLYNRALEPWESQLNANVDQIRYRGTDGSTLSWPDGFRYENGSVQCRSTVATRTYSKLAENENKVKFNDGTPASPLTAWNPVEETGTLTPVPDANHKFLKWEGADGLAVSPEGVLTLDGRVHDNLVCVFIPKATTVRTWTGEAGDGDWATGGNWDPAGTPGESDMLTIPAGQTAVLGCGEDTPEYLLVDCAGTLVMSNWTTRLCVAGDVHIYDGGVLTCADAILDGPATTASSYVNQTFSRVNVSCGSLTVDAGGTIDLRLKGWRGSPGTVSCPGNGPGATASSGPAHGGHGGSYRWTEPASGSLVPMPLPYDDPAAPVQPGSSGASYHANGNNCRGSSGGGVLRVEASGTVTVNGTITADGQNTPSYGAAGWNGFACSYAHAGAGGSLYITCRDLVGSGVISANGGGGDLYNHSTAPSMSGGGGCIAIYYDANVQQAAAVQGMKITAAAGHYYTRAQYSDGHWEILNPGAVGETGRTQSDLGTLRFTDGKLVDALLGNGLSGQVAGITPYTYSGDLSFTYGQVRFADTGAVVAVTGDLTFGGDDSRLEIGGCEATRRSLYIEIYAGNEVNKLTVGGDLTLGGVSRLDVRAAETNGVDSFGAEVKVGGTMTIGEGCFVYSWSDVLNTGSPHFEVGNLNVATGGTFTATRRGGAGARVGAYHVYGKSTGGNNYIGGGHGGKGGRATASAGCVSDDVVRPALVGAGGGSASVYGRGGAGGGIVQVAADGTIRVDGKVLANGENASEYGSGGAGGTILLEARQLLVGETALITAKGGNINPTSITVGGGGGGRIAFYAGRPWSAALPRGRTVKSEEPFAAETYPGEFLFLCPPPDVSGGIASGGTVANGVPGEEGTVRYCYVNEAPGLLLLVR